MKTVKSKVISVRKEAVTTNQSQGKITPVRYTLNEIQINT